MGKSKRRLTGFSRNGGKEAFKCSLETRSLVNVLPKGAQEFGIFIGKKYYG